jgi:hypothetical protein
METYEYINVVNIPDLLGIHEDVASSEMTNKDIEFCRWDEDIATVKVIFAEALSPEDLAILDGIVASNCS